MINLFSIGRIAFLSLCFSACGLNVDNIKNNKSELNIINGFPLENNASRIGLATVALIDDINAKSFCSGTLIDGYTVLTAAHCLTDKIPAAISVKFSNINSQKSIKVYNFVIHPKYDYTAAISGNRNDLGGDDIALIRLEEDAIKKGFGNLVNIDFDNKIKLKPQDKLTLAGYGLNEKNEIDGILRIIDAKIIALMTKYGTIDIKAIEKNEGTCSGDSGGPAYYQINTAFFVVGVLSYGNSNCSEGFSFYINIDKYKQWIKDKSANLATVKPKNMPMDISSFILSNGARVKTIRCEGINEDSISCDIVTPYGTEYNDSLCTYTKTTETYLCKVPETPQKKSTSPKKSTPPKKNNKNKK